MWEEWRKASEAFPTFVHNSWGATNNIDISRNLSKFGKIGQQAQEEEGEQAKAVKRDEGSAKKLSQNENSAAAAAATLLIDESEVLSVLFRQVDDMGDDSSDDDEKDNIYSKLEVRQERKPETDGPVIDVSGREACGYCQTVCFCAPGHRNVRPYVPTNARGPSSGPTSLLGSNLLRLDNIQDEATNTIAKLLSAKLESPNSGLSHKLIKERYANRADQLISSINEAFELANEVRSGSGKLKDDLKPVWSSEQAKEMLQMEVMQDLFQANYSSPYEGEGNRSGRNESFLRKKRKSNSEMNFMSKQFLENY